MAWSTRERLVAAALAGLFLAFVALNFWFSQLPSISFLANDISYYGFHLNDMLMGGNPDVMPEYPAPAVWLLALLYLLGGGWQTWQALFVTVMIVLSAAVALTLFRREAPQACLFWIVFTGVSGPLIWFRFDLLPAALVVWACLWLGTHPRLAGALVAVGASIKLWPALLAAPMAAPNPLRPGKGRRRLVSFLAVGLLLGMASLLFVGWERSASPLTWQSDRGLQMESVPASVVMFLRTFTNRTDWTLFLSDYNAIELAGPGVDASLTASTVLTVGSLLLTAVLTWRLLRRFHSDEPALEEAILLAVLAILLAMIVANKTLSPQYIPWLGGPVAVLLLTGRRRWWSRHVAVQGGALVLVAALTQYTYPWATMAIMQQPNGSAPESSALLLRNVLLLILLIHAVWLSWRATVCPALGKLASGSKVA